MAQPTTSKVPWGLVVALAVYALFVLGYVWATYWNSDEYQAAVHVLRARELLGPSRGRTASREQLIEAYDHLLEAARRVPQVGALHDELESLNWRFEERRFAQPPELRHRADAVAVTWRRIQEEQAPMLVVGARNRGWAPDQLAEGPKRVLRWSPIGAGLIVVAWAFLRFSKRSARAKEHEAELQAIERDLEEADRSRRPRR